MSNELDNIAKETKPIVVFDNREKPYDGWKKFINGPIHICITPRVRPDGETPLDENNLYSIWQCKCGQHFKFVRGGWEYNELVWTRIAPDEVKDGLPII